MLRATTRGGGGRRRGRKVEKWLRYNKLTLNLSKTTFMIVSPLNKKLRRPTSFEVKFSGYSLTKSQQTKYLGIFVDENLNWDAHIKSICNKLSHISGIFYKLRRLISQDALIVLYYSLVQSHLTYGLMAREVQIKLTYSTIITSVARQNYSCNIGSLKK